MSRRFIQKIKGVGTKDVIETQCKLPPYVKIGMFKISTIAGIMTIFLRDICISRG